jgi:trimethylamine--corrinoid protein Co-methyltransferase
MARKLCATAPSTFASARHNPERSAITVGGNNLVLAPVCDPPFVYYWQERAALTSTVRILKKFVKPGYMSKWLHHSGGTVLRELRILPDQ